MNKIIYVVFFIIHIFIYYKAFHNECIQKVDEYYKEQKHINYIDGKAQITNDVVYEFMKEEWVQDILKPISIDCHHHGLDELCDIVNFYVLPNKKRPCLIPFDKILKIMKIENDGIRINDYYFTNSNNNRLKLDKEKENIVPKTTHPYYNKDPFYFVECIAQWEYYKLNQLSSKCRRKMRERPRVIRAFSIRTQTHGSSRSASRRDHSEPNEDIYPLDIIHDVIYPRYLHYKTISHLYS